MKKKYEGIVIELIELAKSDVLSTSNEGEWDVEDLWIDERS